MLAINKGRPEVLDLKKIIASFVEFREEVVTRRTAYDLREARKRAHIVVGLVVAVANIDEIIRIIRAAKDPEEARRGLMEYSWPAEDIRPLIELLDEPDAVSPKTAAIACLRHRPKAFWLYSFSG